MLYYLSLLHNETLNNLTGIKIAYLNKMDEIAVCKKYVWWGFSGGGDRIGYTYLYIYVKWLLFLCYAAQFVRQRSPIEIAQILCVFSIYHTLLSNM